LHTAVLARENLRPEGSCSHQRRTDARLDVGREIDGLPAALGYAAMRRLLVLVLVV